MYTRLLEAKIQKTSKSVLILGPRQVGKSTLIQRLKPDLKINLANESEYFRFQTELSELERRIEAQNPSTVFIDEIQRIPRLTNTIQSIVDENPKIKFYLTGSSARKLRKGKANLLPGRLMTHYLAPLAWAEIQNDWNESQVLAFGSLPGIYTLQDKQEKKQLLKSYTSTYLKEEILAESLVRQVDGFVRFLSTAAYFSGQFLDFSKLAKQAKIPRQSVARHFEILEDTLIAQKVENDPDLDLEQVDLVKHPKFFFFDLGVLNALRGSFDVNQERIGFLFEHMVFNQIYNAAFGKSLDFKIHNFRTRGGLEVDFILNLEGKKFAIECKASRSITRTDLGPMGRIKNYYPKIQKLIIYRGQHELKEDGIWILPFPKAISVLGLA